MNDSPPLVAYESLAHSHENMLLAYILALVPDRMQAEDLAQETFIIAYHKLDTLRRPEAFAPWIRGIARHLSLSFLRKNNREIPFDPETLAGLENGFETFDDSRAEEGWLARAEAVHQCLDALPEKLGTVFKEHYLQERKIREIAVQQSVAVAAVLKRLERARDCVKECVQRRMKLEEFR